MVEDLAKNNVMVDTARATVALTMLWLNVMVGKATGSGMFAKLWLHTWSTRDGVQGVGG